MGHPIRLAPDTRKGARLAPGDGRRRSGKSERTEAKRPGKPVVRQVISAQRSEDGRRDLIIFGTVLSAPIVLGGLLLYIWTHVSVIRLGYRLAEERTVQSRLLEKNRMLRLEEAKFASLHRVEALAIKEIGLIKPTPDQVVILP